MRAESVGGVGQAIFMQRAGEQDCRTDRHNGGQPARAEAAHDGEHEPG